MSRRIHPNNPIHMDTTAPQQSTTVNDSQRQDGASRRGGGHGVRFSRFCFTINGTEQQLSRELGMLMTLTPKWLIVAQETCPTTGRRHLQGACVWGKQVPFSVLKDTPGLGRAHIENMKGTPLQNRTYCTKEDKEPYEYGEMPQPGKRNDLHAAIEILREGTTIPHFIATADTPLVATYVRYPRGLTQISQAFREHKRRVQPFVLWLHGATGTGKTRSAYELGEYLGCSSDTWVSNASLQWFDGYNGHRVAILDDYRTNHAKFSFVLRLLDRYLFQVPIKGGFVNWQPNLIIVTTPKSPTDTWNLRTQEDLAQLSRRVTLCIDTDKHADSYELLRGAIFEQFGKVLSESTSFPYLSGLLRDAEQLSGLSDSRAADSSESRAVGGRGSLPVSRMDLSTSEATDEDTPVLQSPRLSYSSSYDDRSGQSQEMDWKSRDLSSSSSSEESCFEKLLQGTVARTGA